MPRVAFLFDDTRELFLAGEARNLKQVGPRRLFRRTGLAGDIQQPLRDAVGRENDHITLSDLDRVETPNVLEHHVNDRVRHIRGERVRVIVELLRIIEREGPQQSKRAALVWTEHQAIRVADSGHMERRPVASGAITLDHASDGRGLRGLTVDALMPVLDGFFPGDAGGFDDTAGRAKHGGPRVIHPVAPLVLAGRQPDAEDILPPKGISEVRPELHVFARNQPRPRSWHQTPADAIGHDVDLMLAIAGEAILTQVGVIFRYAKEPRPGTRV